MKTRSVLVTGAGGEIGRALIAQLLVDGASHIVALDLQAPTNPSDPTRVEYIVGDILDRELLTQLEQRFDFETIFHLAALLSTSGERNPQRAHDINVNGSVGLLELARRQSETRGSSTVFVFPSTIAVYGIDTASAKAQAGKVREDQFLNPITMYGANKLYVEHLGRYYSRHFRMLDADASLARVDFRSVRLPGVVSAHTVPSGGTSDYGPEMLHFAAQGKPYRCFVGPEAQLPFMVMSDAVLALSHLARAPRSALSRIVYNVGSFSLTAAEFRDQVLKVFPNAEVTFEPHPQRASIVESWPADVDDSAARTDWGWQPQFDLERAFAEYLVPGIVARYAPRDAGCNDQRCCANG